jgi:hypothetical protein
MHQTKTLVGLCLAVALLGLVVASCGKGYKQIVVVDGGATEFVTLGKLPEGTPQDVWVPGRVLIFRTDSTVPGSPNGAQGKAGRVYRITDQQELEEIGEFPLTMPNDTLAYRYGA